MRLFLAFPALLLATAAQAQAPSPAQMGITSTTTPEVLQTLDSSKTWVPIGNVDPTTHTVIGLGQEFYVRQFGPHNDWVGDDGPAIAAALNAASAAGGGTVYLDQKSYWNQTQALFVPKGVALRCVGAFIKFDVNYDYTNRPCTIYQKSGTSLRVDGAIISMGVLQDQVHFANITTATTRAQWTTFVNGFTGLGVAVGDLLGTNESGSQAVIQNVQIGGFNLCIKQNGADQVQMRQIIGDCINGLDINNSFDNNYLSDIEFWGFLSTHKPISSVSWPITAIADNGSGSWRVTFTAASGQPPPATGEQIWVYPGNGGTDGSGPGASGSAGLWTVTAVDSTHVDLQTSVTAPTTTGTTTAGQTYIPVASTADLQVGMNVSGPPGIPAGATIGAVWRSRAAINLDQAHEATASASSVALSFSSVPFTSDANAKMFWSANARSGAGFAIGRADGTSCSACFQYGYRIGFNFRDAIFTNFTNSNSDGNNGGSSDIPNKNATSIGVEFTGISYANFFQTASNTTNGVHVLSNAPSSPGNVVQINDPTTPSNNSTIIENDGGTLTAQNSSLVKGGNILLDYGGLTQTIMTSMFLQNVRLYGTGPKPNFYGAGNLFASGNSSDPMFDQRSPFGQMLGSRPIVANNVGPALDFYNGGEAANEKLWRWFGNNKVGGMCLQSMSDDYLTAGTGFCAHRNGAVTTDITISAPLNATGSITGTSSASTTPFSLTASSLNGNQSVLSVIGGDNTNSGGQIKLANANAGATTPNKFLRVKNTGEFQIVNSAYSAGVMTVDDVGNLIMLGSVITGGYTIGGTLPACAVANKGATVWVSNGQASPPYLGAVSATGAVVAPVFCNGSGWVYH